MQNGPQERILWLLRWLQDETDESRPIDSREILARWEHLGLKTDRRSVYKDIQILRKVGYEVHQHRGESNCYWMDHEGRKPTRRKTSFPDPFSKEDLGHLMDAVQVCRALSDKTRDALLRKIRSAPFRNDGMKLQRPLITDRAYREDNVRLEQNLDKIYTAIAKKRKLLYRENVILTKKGFMRQMRQERIRISPYYVRWDRQHYLLVGWSDKESRIVTIRVDEMYKLGITENRRRPFPKDLPLPHYDNFFEDGNTQAVQLKLLCTKDWIPEILDLFGNESVIAYAGDRMFAAKVHAPLGLAFSRWLASTGGEVKIIKMSAQKNKENAGGSPFN